MAILDRLFETIKAHVKAGNSVAKERWDAIESAWGLKQNGVFDEEWRSRQALVFKKPNPLL